MDNIEDSVDDWRPFYRNHVFALVNDDDKANEVKKAILETEVDETNLKIYKGCEGYIQIDPEGKFHGLKGKVLRALQVLGEELPVIKHFADHVVKGDIGFGIPYRNDEHKDEILRRLKDAQAKEMVYTTLTSFYIVNK